MQDTPLYHALCAQMQKKYSRFHMPGHKGALYDLFSSLTPYDFTEIPGTDSLFEAEGCLLECEQEFARLYGAHRTLLSAGGSTLCIQTMLALAAKPGQKVIAGRNLHRAAVSAMALLDLQPVWVYPSDDCGPRLPGRVSVEGVRQALEKHPDAACVYLTSPDYFGVLTDIQSVSKVCHAAGVPLLVDNAHGAHLRFLTPSLHPLQQGADLCCDSLHKTLPVLTGGALLHSADPKFSVCAKERMAMFGSTSPSYLILLSLDRCLAYLTGRAKEDMAYLTQRVAKLQDLALQNGFTLPPGPADPTRLALGFWKKGISREIFWQHLHANRLEPEYVSESYGVFLPSAFNSEQDFARLETAIRTAPQEAGREEGILPLPRLCSALSIRQATFAPCETLPVEQCAGRVCARMQLACPPGVPAVMPGEKIKKSLLSALKNRGIFVLDVVK